MDDKFLDIEFAIDNSLNVFILQVDQSLHNLIGIGQ